MSRFSDWRRVTSFWSNPRSQEAFEGSNGMEELIVFQLLQWVFDLDFFRAQGSDGFNVRLGLVLPAFLDRLFAVGVEIICQGVEEVRREAIAGTDWLTPRVR
jgi:hypothetical protein